MSTHSRHLASTLTRPFRIRTAAAPLSVLVATAGILALAHASDGVVVASIVNLARAAYEANASELQTPTFSISDVSSSEGNGGRKAFTFTVTTSANVAPPPCA